MICRLIVVGWKELLILHTAATASTLLGANVGVIHSFILGKRHLNKFLSRLEKALLGRLSVA